MLRLCSAGSRQQAVGSRQLAVGEENNRLFLEYEEISSVVCFDYWFINIYPANFSSDSAKRKNYGIDGSGQ